ncbi:uncharacterized protein FTOL_05407 [Fusarium torulosum]|uniref:Hydrophobin n=1 Tax=Fusarium torulosum TaxID=33205 RepID=A0AAE8SH84_9HYPO|nr:uncharacterized protein FTOL_05407 [Fusarium torulosum]
MKFTAVAVLAIATGALASPAPWEAPKVPKPPTVKQTNTCGNGQALFCCSNNEKDSSVHCVSFTNGGIGGICNGIQMCCNNNNNNIQGSGSASQSCGISVGGGSITFSDGHKQWV